MEISATPHQTNVTEIKYTQENQKIDLIENSQPPNNSPMLITSDVTPINWNTPPNPQLTNDIHHQQ